MTSAPPRAPVGSARDVREHLAGARRPFLVSCYAALFSESGVLGRPLRRRTVSTAIRAMPAAVAVGVAALVVARAFVAERGDWIQGAALATLLVAVLSVSWRRARRAGEGRRASVREQLEIGGLFLAAAFAVAQTSEAPAAPGDGPLFPIVYLVLAFLVASFQRSVGASLGLCAVALDAACWWSRGARPTELATLAAHAAFLLLFAVLFHAVLAARLGAARRAERVAVARRMRDIDQRAREFRLLAPAAPAAVADDEEWARRTREAAVVEVESALRGACRVAAAALRARSAAVFAISDDDRELHLREWASVEPARVVPAGEGPLAAVVSARAAVRLDGAFDASWCETRPKPKAMLALPLERGGHVRGVLLVDRAEPQPFTADDERLLGTVASEILRAMDSERVMSDLKRAREEKERFHQALERLNKTTKAREVCDAVLEVAGGMVAVDFGAVTLTDHRSGVLRHRIVRVHAGEHAGSGVLEGAEFEDVGKGLVASCVRLASSLPGVELDLSKAIVFDEAKRPKGLASLKVLPLKTGDRVLGTLVLGARKRGAYPTDVVRQLEVVAMQAADAILRARLFDETERLATTDGLTGLLNHRVFQSRLDEHVAAAVRYSKKLSFLLTDVDHFKKVNDTYGHPAGDEVLRGVARILAREARSTDLVARYGGEEFAIVMPETDAAGALVIAERIREKVGAAVFRTGAGELRATISIGVATIPDDARAKARLVELADAALYRAKRGGRNRSVAAGQREAA